MSAHSEDSALATLLLPIVTGRIAWPASALFLRARAGAPLKPAAVPGIVCHQTFRPDADALERAGLDVVGDCEAYARSYPLVLLLPPRQRDESRALMARALAATQPGGIVIACAANNEGARSAEDDLARLAGPLHSLVKNKCRVFWTRPLQGIADPALAAEWQAHDAIRPIGDGRFRSRPGVFAWDRIDPASQLLADNLPSDLTGTVADLGAGFGFLSVELLTRCRGIKALDLYEAEGRALEVAKLNLASLATTVSLGFHWHDVTRGLPRFYDAIVTNPPFHTQNRADRPDIGRRFISVANAGLRAGGSLWLVANRHLPYEAALADHFHRIRKVAERDGFKIIEALKNRAS